ncbi:MAG: hypothetical protein A2511_15840 [Deltaproteobacteria bacterium RIFOXYD12_FULL_50_9]|nr:MAG: hypothetical protein A2511_15840 [Deltaproteobacteria bacterium RIFOXYD12_FULL_50_9]
MADEIIEELWKIKDGIAHEHAYNVDALVAHLKAKVLSPGQKVVDLRAMKTAGQNRKRKNQRHKIAEQPV